MLDFGKVKSGRFYIQKCPWEILKFNLLKTIFLLKIKLLRNNYQIIINLSGQPLLQCKLWKLLYFVHGIFEYSDWCLSESSANSYDYFPMFV